MTAWYLMPPVWKLPVQGIEWKDWKTQKKSVIHPKSPDWIPIDKVSKNALHAIIAAEDTRFYSHGGLDYTEIYQSLKINIKEQKIIRGGSTITQQVVKIAFLTPQKSLIRKIREALGALALEQVLTKDEILGWYINSVEFGDGIHGIHNAAEHYFGTKPNRLTIQQAVNLALVLPGPNVRSKSLKRRQLSDLGRKRYFQILKRMYEMGFITKTLKKYALATGDFGRPIITEGSRNQQVQVKISQRPVEPERVLFDQDLDLPSLNLIIEN